MKKQEKLVLIILGFVIILLGASVLYKNLAGGTNANQLAVQTPETTENGETAQAGSDGNSGTDENSQGNAEAEKEQPAAPDFLVYDAEGNEAKLSDYIGKPVVLNFWASWCGPCRSEMPEFNEKYLELGEEVQFLMVNMTTSSRETLDNAKAHIEEMGYSFPVLYDLDSDAATTYGVYSLPTTYFVSADGYLVAQATGAIDGELLQQGIDMIR